MEKVQNEKKCSTKITLKVKEIVKYQSSPIRKHCNMERVHHKKVQHKKVQHKDSA